MKKVLRIIILLLIAIVIVFCTVAVLNMISKGIETRTIIFGAGTGVIIIAMCIFFFILLGKKKS